MDLRECWFCADPASAGNHLQVNMKRDERETFIVIGVYRRWKQITLLVPRCQRCRVGHGIARVVQYILIGSAAITGLMLLAWGASRASGERWADEWQLVLPVIWTLGWVLVWQGIRGRWFSWRWLAPRPERYSREYPAVLELVEEGWN